MNKEPIEIEYSEWWRVGNGVMYRRDCLPSDHPQQTYNYVRNKYGVRPERYGIERPFDGRVCSECGRGFT